MLLAVLIFAAAAALALLEAPSGAYESRGDWRREARISIILGAAALMVESLLPDAAASATFGGSAGLFIVVFVADDLLYYGSHRLAHRVSLFWASHAVHHSPSRYNLLTGLRQPPTWLFTPAAAAPLALLLLGAPAALVAASAALRGTHHFLIHTERIRRLPHWIEFVFNTPSHHRVHHATERDCIDRNFGGVLIIWDRLFGTFTPEPRCGASHYGLIEPTRPTAWRTMADPWLTLFDRMRRAPDAGSKLAVALLPPAPGGATRH